MTAYANLFSRPPAVEAEALGRVNLISEHTDSNCGYVLPIAIPQRTRGVSSTRVDRTVRVWSANVPDRERPAAYVLGAEERCHD